MSLADQSQQWFPTSAQVTVLQARGLRIKGKNGTNDAYAIMQVAKDKFSTEVAEKSVAPMWKEQASFDLPPAHQGNAERGTLRVHVMHRALVGPDKPLGQAVVNLLDLHEVKSRNKTEWFKLVDKSGKADKERGEVLLDIQFMRNNMTASMFDLSGMDKSRSRLGKIKDKLRGKKKDGSGLDSVSAIVPSSFSQVLTDSEEEEKVEEEEEEGTAGVEGAVGDTKGKSGKKKLKLKSLFSHKSTLKKNMSQSMSFLGPLPEKNQTLSGSRPSGLNVEPSEGKKKFKFGLHKRSGSNDSKSSQASASVADPAQRGGPDAPRPGGNAYTEEPTARAGSRASSTFSLSSSGRGSMEDLHRGSVEGSFSSYDSLRVPRPQSSPWLGTKAAEEGEVEEGMEEEVDVSEYEQRRRKQEEEKARQEEQMRIERRREEEEEQRKRLDEERMRREKMEKREVEEQQHKYQRDEEDRFRREREEEERFRREEVKRREVEEERERMKRMEEERKAQEEEEEKFRMKEEMVRIEKERAEREEKERREEERTRLEKEEEEKMKREWEEKQERITIEKEKERLEEESERERVRLEKVKEEEEEERRVREEEEEKMTMIQEREERRLREKELEEERFRMEKEREEERRVREEEERLSEMQEREERKLREKELEEERFRMREEEEERRVREEEERRVREEEARRVTEEEEGRVREEEERRVREEEERRVREEEERRVREEEARMSEMQEIRLRERSLDKERFRMEKERGEEERRVREEEEARMSEMQEKERRVRERELEEERFRMEKEREEEERRVEEETTRIEKAKERQKEEGILMEAEERRRREVAEEEEQEVKRQEERERLRREESLLEEERIKRQEQVRREEQRREDERRGREEEGGELEEEFMTKETVKNTPFGPPSPHKPYLGPNSALTNKSPGGIESARRRVPVRSAPPSEDDGPPTPEGPLARRTADVPTARQSPASRRTPSPLFEPSNPFFEESESDEHLSGKKRRAPPPPSNQELLHDKPNNLSVSTVPSVSPLGGIKTSIHLDEGSDGEKDRLRAARTAPQPPKQHGPRIEPIASKEQTVQTVHATGTFEAPQPSKNTKGPAPAKPNPNRTKVSAQVHDGRPKHAPRPALSLKDTWKNSNMSGPHTVTEQRPSMCGTNPFDEEDEEDEARTPLDADGSSSSKVRSLKAVRAPPPPEDKESSPVKPSRNACSEARVTAPSGVRPMGPPPTGDASETQAPVQPWRTEAVAEQGGRVETAVWPASVGSETGTGPPTPSQRSHPVKPLRVWEQQSAVSSVSAAPASNTPSEITRAGRNAVEVKEEEARGPFSQLTREELILLLQKLQSQLTQRDHKISELEQYIDNLLVRIMEEEPSILMSMNALKH